MSLLAAQLYTLREYTQTPAGYADCCKRVKAMGYDGIQISGFTPDIQDMKNVMDGEGLVCASTHFSLDYMEQNFAHFVEMHHQWNCPFPAIGGCFPPKPELWNDEFWSNAIKRFNTMADRLAAEGLRLGYHNHAHEFSLVDNKYYPFQRLLKELNDNCWFEIDTFWVARGACEPSDMIRKVATRIPCVHLKDLTLPYSLECPVYPKEKMTEVGDGLLNWPGILEACRYAGVKWYIVERDNGDLDPFLSLERSYNNLRNKLGL